MISGAPVEPMDIPLEVRHLYSTLKVLELSDKVPYVFCQSRQRIHDTLSMIAMAKGTDREGLCKEPSTFSIINSNSPLQYDRPMAIGLIELAKHNQLAMITPFSLAGASHPISLGAANSMAVAEMLAALTLTQLVNPGAPVASAAYTMNVNMQTGSPGFGSPETNVSLQIGSQMARFYGIPIRSSTFTSSPALDAQATFETLGMLPDEELNDFLNNPGTLEERLWRKYKWEFPPENEIMPCWWVCNQDEDDFTKEAKMICRSLNALRMELCHSRLATTTKLRQEHDKRLENNAMAVDRPVPTREPRPLASCLRVRADLLTNNRMINSWTTRRRQLNSWGGCWKNKVLQAVSIVSWRI